MTPEEFKAELIKQNINISNKQLEQFDQYYQLLIGWNKKMNLTAITEKKEVYLKHFYDSLTLTLSSNFIGDNKKLCDVGSGAGFPSIPLKIIFPHLEITIVDSLNKRINFLKEVTDSLQLENVHLYHDRAETFGQKAEFRGQFDYVTARAVARLNVLSELCLPLVKKQGFFFAMKAAKSEEELIEAQKAIATLGGKVVEESDVALPISNDPRYVLTIQKKKETPKKYPRKPGTPNRKPL